MTTLTVTRSGNLIGFSTADDGALPDEVRGLLEPALTYTYTRMLRGEERRDAATGYTRPFHVEERRQYRYDGHGRLCCSAGFHKRLATLLAEKGYELKAVDRTPPHTRADRFTIDYDAVAELPLRARQGEAIGRVLSQPCGVVSAPPAFGKTFLVRAMGKALPRARIHVVTRRRDLVKGLVNELSLAFPNVGQVGAGKKKPGRITVFTADSLHLSDADCDILIGDECFPAGTLVDGVPIERIQPGDLVGSVSEEGRLERKLVVRVFKNPVSRWLVRVQPRAGAAFVCTENHPVWTQLGFVPAGALCAGLQLRRRCGDKLVSDVVEAVEPVTPTAEDPAGGLCPDGYVYNLEVADNHTYFAAGVLVHNCHELMSDSYAVELARYRYSRNYGFTATPRGRKDGTDARLEALFGPIIFEITYPEAVDLGLVVPITVRWLDVPGPHNPCDGKADVAKKRWGLWRNPARNQAIADAVREYESAQVLILVETTEHALYLRRHLPEYELCYAEKGMDPDLLQMYRRQGLMGADELPVDARRRDALREAFARGELRKVIATGVWSTGVDFTGLQVLVRADGLDSEIMDFQAPGRVCRLPNAGVLENAADADKQHGMVIDLNDRFDPGLNRKARHRQANYVEKGWTQTGVTPSPATAKRKA